MKNLWNAKEIASATRGKTQGDWHVNAVTIDSRIVEPQALFVALLGEHADGHVYVADAFKRGASAALVSKIPEGIDPKDTRLVLVENTQRALEDLGIAARARSQAKCIGVTGSVGKTGCKEMLAQTLSVLGSVYVTQGNLNNHLGVPLTLANLPKDVDFAVIEMGMNHAGEIAVLSRWVKPHVSIITTVAAVHIEFFDSVEAIADAKSEIFLGMEQKGVALLNSDNAHFVQCKKNAEKAGLDRILSFGTHPQAICRMEHYRIDEDHSQIEASIAGTKLSYTLGTIGKHWALMSVAVLGVVDALHGNLPKAAEALKYFTEPKGRGQIVKLGIKGGHLRLIDDSYNASPVSMCGAFDKLAEIRTASKPPVRTLVVLGDMLELGENAREMHVGLVPSLINNQIDLVFAAGSFMRHLYDALPETMQGAYDPTAGGLAPKVTGAIKPRDIVLVKGSHGMRMNEVVEAIEDSAKTFERMEAHDAI